MELPITIMIAAIIGLIILVIFFFTLTSEAGEFSKALSCEVKGGQCIAKEECKYQKTNWQCPTEKPECCYNPLNR